MIYDTQKIKESLSMMDVLHAYGEEMKYYGGKTFVRCAAHETVLGRPDNHIGNCEVKKNICKCYSCGAAYDIFQYIQYKEHVTFPEACVIAGDLAGGNERYLLSNSDYQKKITEHVFLLNNEELAKIGLCGNSTSRVMNIKNISEYRTQETMLFGLEYVVCDNTKLITINQLYYNDFDTYYWLIFNKGKERISKCFEVLSLLNRSNSNFLVMKELLNIRTDADLQLWRRAFYHQIEDVMHILRKLDRIKNSESLKKGA